MKALRAWRGLALALSVLALVACASHPRGAGSWHDATQMVVVVTDDWDAERGVLQRYERDGGWRAVGAPVDVTVGRNGSAWGRGLHPDAMDDGGGPAKREGDGRAPAGVFAIGGAFGIEPSPRTGLRYQPMTARHHCIDVPGSPLYNRIVDTAEVGEAAVQGSTEPMRRDLLAKPDMRYALGFVIEHNTAAVPAGGSCIFAHAWDPPGATTAGCTAMDLPRMRELLAWLDARRRPVFVLLPRAAYRQHQARWGLPASP